jgi:hypothetical protein
MFLARISKVVLGLVMVASLAAYTALLRAAQSSTAPLLARLFETVSLRSISPTGIPSPASIQSWGCNLTAKPLIFYHVSRGR